MVPMPVALRSGEARNQYVRAKGSDYPHHVGECDIVSAPLLKCFFRILRISEIRYPAKALLDPVIAIGSRQLQRAQHAQNVEEIASYLVLPAFAARESHEQRGGAVAARLECQHAAVFV